MATMGYFCIVENFQIKMPKITQYHLYKIITQYNPITQYNHKQPTKMSTITPKLTNRNTTFIQKLLTLLQDKQCHEYIQWLDTENGFNIINVSGFTQNVLPAYFKHQNFSSFVRQLNMYGFSKVRGRDREGENVYQHRNFKRGSKANIKKIHRKISSQNGEKNYEIVAYKPGQLCHNKRRQQQIGLLRQKQVQLQKKCIDLLSRNRQLLQQNELISKTIQSEQLKKKKLIQQIFSLIKSTDIINNNNNNSNNNNNNNSKQKHLQNQHDPLQQKQKNASQFFHENQVQVQFKQKQQSLNLLDANQESFLNLSDFINIDCDELNDSLNL